MPDLDWDAAYVSYLSRVRAAESTAEYYQLLASFIALLHDGHTGVTPPRELWPQLWAEAPLGVSLIEGRPIVTDIYDASLASLRGMELTAVDGIPVKQYAAGRVAPYQPASSPQDLDSRTWRRVLWGAEGTRVDLVFVDAKGRTVQRAVRRLTDDEEKKVIVQPPSFEYRLLPGNIAYVAMNQFGDSKAAEEFEARFDEIAKSSGLIIDVRRNGGGNSGNGYRVLSALTDKPFQTSKWSTRDYKPAYRAWGRPEETFGEGPGEVPPSGSRLYSKPVVVLTSAQTYSAAEDFVVAFDAMKRGTVIGEPTGGSTGQPLMLKLPGGGFARICTKRDSYPDGKEFVGVGVQPQVVVHPTVSDTRAKKDTVLDAAVAYLKKRVRSSAKWPDIPMSGLAPRGSRSSAACSGLRAEDRNLRPLTATRMPARHSRPEGNQFARSEAGMSDLEIIAADLRRQREQLERALEDTSSRCDSTADLIRKIEELNRRVAETQIEKRVADR